MCATGIKKRRVCVCACSCPLTVKQVDVSLIKHPLSVCVGGAPGDGSSPPLPAPLQEGWKQPEEPKRRLPEGFISPRGAGVAGGNREQTNRAE